MGNCPRCNSVLKVQTSLQYIDFYYCTECGEYCYSDYLSCCRKPYYQIRQHEIANGVQLRKQCLTCGCIGGQSLKKIEVKDWQRLSFTDKIKHEEFSKSRYKQAHERSLAYRNYYLENRETARLKKYDAYLKSPEWANKRQLVLQRDGHICQSCLQPTATQVHHLTYNHLYNEPLFELVSICVPCHESITAMDKGQSCEPIQYPVYASF